MAVDSLSTDFRKKVNVRVGTDTDYVDFDASLRETHTKDSEITDYPVESGANLADHQRPLPLTLQMTGIVSRTPIPASPPSNTNPGSFISKTRVEDARNKMIAFRNNSTPLKVVTDREVYANMLIKTITESVDPTNANDFECEISFKQVVTATAQFVQVPAGKGPPQKATKDLGTQNPATTSNTSALVDMSSAK